MPTYEVRFKSGFTLSLAANNKDEAKIKAQAWMIDTKRDYTVKYCIQIKP